jgi:hypothetical protein
VRNARNVGIILLLGLVVAFVPHGGNVAEALLTALTMGLLAGITWMLYRLSRENQLTLATLGDGRRAVFYGAFGVLALLVAWANEMFTSGSGTVLWIFLLAASVVAIWRIWLEANTY